MFGMGTGVALTPSPPEEFGAMLDVEHDAVRRHRTNLSLISRSLSGYPESPKSFGQTERPSGFRTLNFSSRHEGKFNRSSRTAY